MSELFDDEDLIGESPDHDINEELNVIGGKCIKRTLLDVRRKLELALEEKRLREELDDFTIY